MPAYDFTCDGCAQTVELVRPMAQAGAPAPCAVCAAPMRRVYDLNVGVIMRPEGYSLPHGHPDFWKGFNDPLPRSNDSLRGRAKRARPGPDHATYGKEES